MSPPTADCITSLIYNVWVSPSWAFIVEKAVAENEIEATISMFRMILICLMNFSNDAKISKNNEIINICRSGKHKAGWKSLPAGLKSVYKKLESEIKTDSNLPFYFTRIFSTLRAPFFPVVTLMVTPSGCAVLKPPRL